MMGAGKADVRGEAEEFTETLAKFLSTLGAVIRSAAEWLGLVVVDLATSKTGDLSGQADTVAAATRSRAKKVRKKSRNLLVKLVLVAVFFWWLDRDLSGADD